MSSDMEVHCYSNCLHLLIKKSSQPTIFKSTIADNLRKPRLGHVAWTPSPLPVPDFIVVFGGRSNMTEFDAEFLPGKEGMTHSQMFQKVEYGLPAKI